MGLHVKDGRSRTTRTDLRRAKPPKARRTPRSPHTTRWESPVGGESPPSGARTPADQAPPEARCSTGSHSDEPVASEKRAARCAWPARHTPHSRVRQPPRSSDRHSAPAEGQRHQVRHHGPPRLVRAPPLSELPYSRRRTDLAGRGREIEAPSTMAAPPRGGLVLHALDRGRLLTTGRHPAPLRDRCVRRSGWWHRGG